MNRLLPIVATLLSLLFGGAAVHHVTTASTTTAHAAAAGAGTPSASPHLALGTPVDADPSDDYLIQRKQYAVSYNHAKNGPNWAAWRLTAADYGGQARASRFSSDETLPAGWYRVKHDDYRNSGYDRGHLVRSEDRTASRADNDATFVLSNVLPQRHGLNAGPWLRLEDQCRALAQHDGRQLYIVAGSVWGDRPATIGHGIAVPVGFWKVVVVLAPGQGPESVTPSTPVIAVVMPNVENPAARWEGYQVSLTEAERRSGYSLLGRVPEATRAALRGRSATSKR